jgi:hypothetical protein
VGLATVVPVTTRHALLLLGAGLLLYLIVQLGFGQIVAMIVALRWVFVPVMALYAGHQAARAWALMYCVPKQGLLSYRDALAVRLSGEAIQFLTFSGPILSEPTKAWMLQRRGLTVWEGLATTLAEYLASSLAAAVMAIAGLGYVLVVVRPAGPVGTAAVVILLAMLAFTVLFVVGIGLRVHFIGGLVRAVARLPVARQRLRGRIDGLPAAEDLLINTLGGSLAHLAGILAIEALGQMLLGIELFLLLTPLEPAMGLGRSVLLEGSTKFITGGLFFVPGQVGVAEGSYALLFALFGLSTQAGVAVSFVRRLRSMATAGIGLAALSRGTSSRDATAESAGRSCDG